MADENGGEIWLFVWLILAALCILSLIARGNQATREDFRGVPFVFYPLVFCIVQIRAEFRLLRRQRIVAFLKLAHDFRVRKKRIDGIPPRRSRS